MQYKITENVFPLASDVNLGDEIVLNNQTQTVIASEKSGRKMLNIDADQLAPGDLTFIKKLGLTISNPNTTRPIALGESYESVASRVADFFDTESSDDDDDDSSFFHSSGVFGGSSSFGGFSGGGFGGFGGGSFSGGGASGSF